MFLQVEISLVPWGRVGQHVATRALKRSGEIRLWNIRKQFERLSRLEGALSTQSSSGL